MIKKEDVYHIGRLGKTHGVKGEVSLQFEDDIFAFLFDWNLFEDDLDGILVPFFLEEYRFRSDSVCLVKFCDVDTQQRASELTGCEVYFPRQLADAEDEAPMLAFLVGFEIINAADGNRIGSIVDIDDQTANILFILDNGMLIPASDELISNIDTTSSTIIMNIPDGLLEI